jgi:hypothetical protein
MTIEMRESAEPGKQSALASETSPLFLDAYAFGTLPAPGDRLKTGKQDLSDRTKEVAAACDPYWDLVDVRERLNRLAGVAEELHRTTRGIEGQPVNLQRALGRLDGARPADLALLQTLLSDNLDAARRGIGIRVSADGEGHVHLNLSRTADGVTYNLDLSHNQCSGTSRDRRGNVTSLTPTQAFEAILPVNGFPRKPEA